MHALSQIIHSVSGIFGRVPEWAPHDHTRIGTNVPYGGGMETMYGSRHQGGYGRRGRGHGRGHGYGHSGYSHPAMSQIPPGFGYVPPAYGNAMYGAGMYAPSYSSPMPAWGGAAMLGASPWGFDTGMYARTGFFGW